MDSKLSDLSPGFVSYKFFFFFAFGQVLSLASVSFCVKYEDWSLIIRVPNLQVHEWIFGTSAILK